MEAMWILECELHAIGFRRRSDDYWQCERRFGLPLEVRKGEQAQCALQMRWPLFSSE
jgi:hypothetical protein